MPRNAAAPTAVNSETPNLNHDLQNRLYIIYITWESPSIGIVRTQPTAKVAKNPVSKQKVLADHSLSLII